MSNETTGAAPNGGPAPDPDLPMLAMRGALEKHLEAASVEAVYGEPVVSGDTVVITSAEVFSVLGVGAGYGSGSAGEGAGAQAGRGFGGGGGGGGRVLSRPVAAIVIRPGGVTVQPIVDVTKLGLAALTAIGFMAGMAATMGNRRRAMRAIQGKP